MMVIESEPFPLPPQFPAKKWVLERSNGAWRTRPIPVTACQVSAYHNEVADALKIEDWFVALDCFTWMYGAGIASIAVWGVLQEWL